VSTEGGAGKPTASTLEDAPAALGSRASVIEASAAPWFAVLLLASALIAWGVRGILDNVSHTGYLWIVVGMAIAAVWSFVNRPLDRLPCFVWSPAVDTMCLIFCCALSFAFRAYKLHERPWGLHNDLGWGACMAAAVLEGGTIPIQSGGYLYGSVYSLVPAFYLLGPSVFSLRLTFAVLGVLGTLGVFCLSRIAFGSLMALAAGLLSAVSPFEIGFERNADMPALLIAYGAPLLAFLWWSLSRQSWIAPILAGIFLALFTPSYAAAKSIGPVFFVATAAYALIRKPLPRRRLLAQLLLVVVCYVAVAFPFFREALTDFRQLYMGEIQYNILARANVGSPAEHLARNIQVIPVALLSRGRIGEASCPGPAVEPALLVLLFLGAAVLLGRFWDPLPFFCLAATAVAFAPALLGPTFETRRAVFIAPLLTVLPVAGLAAVVSEIRTRFRTSRGVVIGVCVAALVVAIVLSANVRKYLKYQLPSLGEGVPNRVFGEFLVSLNDKYFVFIDDEVGVIDTAYFLLYSRYHENEYILTRYNSNPAIIPSPGHYRLHNFARDGLPAPPTHDRPVIYVLFRWDQQYGEIVPLVRQWLADVKHEARRYELAVPGSTFRYVVFTFTIPVEAIDQIKHAVRPRRHLRPSAAAAQGG
jgi:hypothetical protein